MNSNRNMLKKNTFHITIFAILVVYLLSANFIFDKVITLKNESIIQKIDLLSEENKIVYCIDNLSTTKIAWKDFIEVQGWAFIKNNQNQDVKSYLVLKSLNDTYIFTTGKVLRRDLIKVKAEEGLKSEYAGFFANISKRCINDGDYRIGIYTEQGDVKSVIYSDKYFQKYGTDFNEGIMARNIDIIIPDETGNITAAIDIISLQDDKGKSTIAIQGWAHVKDNDANNQNVFVTLVSPEKEYVFGTITTIRPDVTKALGNGLNLDNSGFKTTILKNGIISGKYKIGIYISLQGKEYYQTIDNEIQVE